MSRIPNVRWRALSAVGRFLPVIGVNTVHERTLNWR